jgi:hypothetical protein
MKNSKRERKKKDPKSGCRGCTFLETNRVAPFPPWECWHPRKSRVYPRVIDEERYSTGCPGKVIKKNARKRKAD